MSGFKPFDPTHNMVLIYGCPPDVIKPFELPDPIPPPYTLQIPKVFPVDPFTGDPLQTYIDQAKEIERLKDENLRYMQDKINLMNQIAELEERERQLIVGCKAAEKHIARLQDKLTKGKRTRGNVP